MKPNILRITRSNLHWFPITFIYKKNWWGTYKLLYKYTTHYETFTILGAISGGLKAATRERYDKVIQVRKFKMLYSYKK
jgi:hypothetical protein